MRQNITDIWERVLDGDPSAWESLVQKFAALVYSVACHSGLSGGDAEDCAQQTWMALYKGRKTVRDPARLPGWLTSTTRRKARRMVLKKSRASEVRDNLDPTGTDIHPDEAIIALQRKAQLDLALEQLDERCQKLLRAIFLSPQELTYKEIALRLGIPPNSLGPTRSRCLNKLKKILDEMDYL